MNRGHVLLYGSLLFVLIGGVFFFFYSADDSDTESNNQNDTTQSELSYEVIVSEVENNDAILLDVRTPEEYDQSHVELAQNLPLQDIEDGATPDVTLETTIYLYCRTGSRSTQAASILRQAGYTVINLGGLNDMQNLNAEFTEE